MTKHPVKPTKTEGVFLLTAALIFVLMMFLAFSPKSPIEPPKLPNFVRQLASEIGGKYWWALAIGGLIAIWFDRKIAWRLILALLFAQIAIETFKFIVGEMRPDGRFFNSFPSGHTTASFAYATVMSTYFRWGWLWFLFATVVGLSRIITNAHWWHDVVGGAALGYIVAMGVFMLPRLIWDEIIETSFAPEQPRHLYSFERPKTQRNQNADQGE